MDTAVSAGVRERLRAIAAQYLADSRGCHQLDHTERVVVNARRLAAHYPAVDREVLEAAAWLHDIGRASEDDGRSHALISAELAAQWLPEFGWSTERIARTLAAIADHRFSAGTVPSSLEGQLLQDADRLDALGAIGIARTFAHGTDRQLYAAHDPFAERRAPEDARYTLDHFYAKLLKLPETLHTAEARVLADERVGFMQCFLREFRAELGEDHATPSPHASASAGV